MGIEENEVQSRIIKYINSSEIKRDFPEIEFSCCHRVNNKGIRGRKSTLECGFPDLVGSITLGGIAICLFVEVKARRKDCKNPEQLKFLAEKQQMGAIAFWCNSLADFKTKFLEQFIQCRYRLASNKVVMGFE